MSLDDTLQKLDGTHPSLDDQALIEGLKVDLEVLSKNTAPKSPSKLPKIKPDQGKGSWQGAQIFFNLDEKELREKATTSPSELAIGDWKRLLSPAAFRVTRLNTGPEPAFSSDLVKVNDPGIFLCVNCEGKLFD